jgi:hypothetical protein
MRHSDEKLRQAVRAVTYGIQAAAMLLAVSVGAWLSHTASMWHGLVVVVCAVALTTLSSERLEHWVERRLRAFFTKSNAARLFERK